MVNTFTSVYAYSMVTFIPGGLLITGSLLAFLKSRFMGVRYFSAPRVATPDDRGWGTCPGCKVRFRISDPKGGRASAHVMRPEDKDCGPTVSRNGTPKLRADSTGYWRWYCACRMVTHARTKNGATVQLQSGMTLRLSTWTRIKTENLTISLPAELSSGTDWIRSQRLHLGPKNRFERRTD